MLVAVLHAAQLVTLAGAKRPRVGGAKDAGGVGRGVTGAGEETRLLVSQRRNSNRRSEVRLRTDGRGRAKTVARDPTSERGHATRIRAHVSGRPRYSG